LYWLIGTGLVVAITIDNLNQNQKIAEVPKKVPSFTGQDIFDAVNKYREENGVQELTLDKNLCNNLAQRYLDVKSGETENIAHKGFDEWYEKYVKPYGNYQIEEDYAWGQTPQEIIKAWDGLPGHRISVLDPKNKLGCTYASEGYAILILGYRQIHANQTQDHVLSRTGKIIPYREWCTGKEISIYENELITKPSSDGNIYSMTQGDWDCYENYLKIGNETCYS